MKGGREQASGYGATGDVHACKKKKCVRKMKSEKLAFACFKMVPNGSIRSWILCK